MIKLTINNKTYRQVKHHNPEQRCKDCDLKEWCFAHEFMMACSLFNTETIFKT